MIAIFPLSTFSIRNKFDLFFLGKGGTKIKEIQAESGARVFVSLRTKYLFVLCFVQLFFENKDEGPKYYEEIIFFIR